MQLPLERRLLAIYLQDHYAGATGGLELCRRAQGRQEGTELGTFLERLAEEIAEDREALRSIMEHLEVEPDRLKMAGGWTAEKLGRLKLNGRVLSESPLSTVVELEGLHLGLNGKLSTWQNLRSAMGERLVAYDLDGLIERAERQIAELGEFRVAAAREALSE